MPRPVSDISKRPSVLSQKTCDKVLKSLKRNAFEAFTIRVAGNGFEIQVGGNDQEADDIANRIDGL